MSLAYALDAAGALLAAVGTGMQRLAWRLARGEARPAPEPRPADDDAPTAPVIQLRKPS